MTLDFDEAPPRGPMLWQLLAFLARYAHQPFDVLLDMTLVDLSDLADAVAQIMKEESELAKRHTDID